MIVSVLNPKGGSSKSTLACLLASYLARDDGRDVVLVDTDLQGSSLAWFAAATNAGVAPPRLRAVEASTAREIQRLPELSRRGAAVVVDGAAKATATMAAAWAVSHLVLVPVRPTHTDVSSLSTVLSVMQANPAVPAYALITQATPRHRSADEAEAAIAAAGLPVLPARMHSRVAYAQTMGAGTSVLDLPATNPAHVEALAILERLTPSFLSR